MSISPHIAENRSGQKRLWSGHLEMGFGRGFGAYSSYISDVHVQCFWQAEDEDLAGPPPSALRNTTLFRFLFYFAHTTSQVKATAIALAIIVPSSRDHLSLEALSHSKPSQPVPPTKTHSTRLDLSPNRAQKERKMENEEWETGGWMKFIGWGFCENISPTVCKFIFPAK